jgi:hypothetical protein
MAKLNWTQGHLPFCNGEKGASMRLESESHPVVFAPGSSDGFFIIVPRRGCLAGGYIGNFFVNLH